MQYKSELSKGDLIWGYVAKLVGLGSGIIVLPLVLHLLDENEIVCVKKPLFVGDILCAKNGTTSITLSEPIENMDTIEIEYAYSATSFRPIRAIMQVASKNIAFSAPVYAVHLLGMQYLNVYSADYSSIICGGSIGSGADYNASVRIFGIYKIQYHTKWVS